MKQLYFFLLLTVVFCEASLHTYYVQPTLGMLNTTRRNLSQNDCCTLNEWIESGRNLSTNDTTMILLPGTHIINSTKDRLVAENIQSFLFTSLLKETTVLCLHPFSFDFVNGRNITVSRLTFKDCGTVNNKRYSDSAIASKSAIVFSQVGDITVYSVELQNAGLVVYQGRTVDSTLYFNNLYITCEGIGIYYRNTDSQSIAPTENIVISNSTLIGASMSMEADASTYNISVQEVLIEHYMYTITPSFSAFQAYTVSITNITIQYCSGTIIDVYAEFVELGGHCSFQWNIGADVHINSGSEFQIHPNILVEFCHNHASSTNPLLISPNTEQEKINIFNSTLYFEDNWSTGNMLINIDGSQMMYFADSQLIFVNNTICSLMNLPRVNILRSKVVFKGNSIYGGYREDLCGVMIISNSADMTMSDTDLVFENNNGYAGGAVMLILNSNVTFSGIQLHFVNNSSPFSGGLSVSGSKILIQRNFNATFEYNKGGDGGGLVLYEYSQIEFSDGCVNFYFHHNKASNRGGAIFVKDSDYIDRFTGTIHSSKYPFVNQGAKVSINCTNNTALTAGNELYGGWIDVIDGISWTFPEDDLYAVTSNPTRICMCANSVPVCNIDNTDSEYKVRELLHGQSFEVEVVAVGQRMGIVPSTAHVQFGDEEGSLDEGQDVQSVGKECTSLQFVVYTVDKKKKLTLKAPDHGVPKHFSKHQNIEDFKIMVEFTDCPLGFEFNMHSKKCSCLLSIELHAGVGCDVENFRIVRTRKKWLLAVFEHNSTQNHGVILYDHCPFDFCGTDADSLTFHLETPDDQCAFNRSGVLCGACQANFSQVFGTSRCKKCSNLWILGILSGTFIAGVLLVGITSTLNLTVSTGTVNGLIFYANIVRVSQAAFFPSEITSSFLNVFIAWLNLDLGIEVCFYDGLDAYAKTWLQFAFPIYIWLIVIAIIVASHYSSTASRFFGNNAVQVLATLFLLSYTKILRVVITVFSFTVLIYPDGSERRVWLIDGNIDYLKGKHVPLFLASLLMFLLLTVPYTFSLVSIQWLQRISHYRLLFWVNRLKPLFDAYAGPYKHRHRYWTGILLLARVVFLLIFSFNYSNDQAINLLAIAVVTTALLVYLSYMGVYKKWLHNVLEITSLLNLGFLSVVTLYQLSSDGNKTTTTYVSTSIAFIIFSLLVLCHAVQRVLSLRKNQLWMFVARLQRKGKVLLNDRSNDHQVQTVQDGHQGITHTSIELCRPLVQNDS